MTDSDTNWTLTSVRFFGDTFVIEERANGGFRQTTLAGAWLVRARVCVPREDLGDTSMRDLKLEKRGGRPCEAIEWDAYLSADRTGSNALDGHIDDLSSHVIGQGSTVDKRPTQLVHAAMAR